MSVNTADLQNAREKALPHARVSIGLLTIKASSLNGGVIFPPLWVPRRGRCCSAHSGHSQKLVIDQLSWRVPFISAEFDLFIVLLQPLCNESLQASAWRIFVHWSHFHRLITPAHPCEATLHPSGLRAEHIRENRGQGHEGKLGVQLARHPQRGQSIPSGAKY